MQMQPMRPTPSVIPIAIPEDRPVYRIKKGKFFADDELYEAGSIIVWPDEPNTEMQPLNGLAKEKMMVFLEKLDKKGKEMAAKTGYAYVDQASAFANAQRVATQDSRRIELLNGETPVPILGTKRNSKKAEKVTVEEEQITLSPNKLSLGITSASEANTAKTVNDTMKKSF